MRVRDEQKEQLIRQKALEMIVNEGFDGFSMQKLAKAAEVAPATIYIYFKDREDLIMQLCRQEGLMMIDVTFKGFDPSMPFAEGLKVQWVNRAKYCLKYPQKMHFLEQIRHSPYHDKYIEIISEKFKATMNEFVNNSIERGELVKVPVEVFWSIAFAPLYSLVKFQVSGKSVGGKDFKFSDKIMMETLSLVLKALKP